MNMGGYDADEMRTVGVYYCTSQSTNLPYNGGMLVVAGSSTSAVQLFLPLSGTARMHTRRYVSGAWQAWSQIA